MITLKCKNCNTKFERKFYFDKSLTHHFCSQSCAAIFNNKGIQRNPPRERICKGCKEKFFRGAPHNLYNLCLKCTTDRKSQPYSSSILTIGEKTIAEYHNLLSVKMKHPSWANAHIRSLNRTWNKDLIKKPCANCGYNLHVELCHRVPLSKFPKTTKLKIVNSSTNIIQLCRNCHWELDHGILLI